MKFLLWKIKEGLKSIFFYPKAKYSKFDYDAYWLDKRGEHIGSLSSWQKDRADFIISEISREKDIDKKMSILDIGCGDGNILNYIKSKINLGNVYGADSSKFALKKADQFGIKTYLLESLSVEEVKKLPNTDYIILLEILEHINNSEEILLECLRKAKLGVFISFPNTGYFIHRLRLFFGKFPVQWRLNPGEHLRFWTVSDLKFWLNFLEIRDYKLSLYKGIPLLNKLIPSLFGAGIIIKINKLG